MKTITCYKCLKDYTAKTGKRFKVPGLKNYQIKCPNCGCKVGIHIPSYHGKDL
jgi:PHP family Zn ribbon phosphoesterase